MNVYFHTGRLELNNFGDVAMMQVAWSRSREFLPDPKIKVLTLRPDLLTTYCPMAEPVDGRGYLEW